MFNIIFAIPVNTEITDEEQSNFVQIVSPMPGTRSVNDKQIINTLINDVSNYPESWELLYKVDEKGNIEDPLSDSFIDYLADINQFDDDGNVLSTNRPTLLSIPHKFAGFTDSPTPSVVTIKGLTQFEFRQRFTATSQMRLDKLELYLEDDAVFDSICTKVSPDYRNNYRDAIRTTFKNLNARSANGEANIFIDSSSVIAGINLYADAGVIDTAERDKVLDTTRM